MARIWQDGFEFNTTTATVATYDTWTSSTIGTTHVRTGTYGLRVSSLASGTPQGVNKKFQTATTSVTFFRAYIYIVTLPTANNTVMAITSSSSLNSSVRASLALTSSGTLILQNASNAQIGSASSAINDSNWHMLEIKMDTTPATGSRITEARLDGTIFATSSTQTTGTQADIFVGGNGLGEAQTTGEWWFDDLAVNDNTGSAQTGYPGSGKILQLYPNAAGDANGFLVQVGGTVGSANNYTRVDEIPPDDATSYNASAVLNAQDLFNVQNSGIGASDTVNTVLVGGRFANITGASATTAIQFQIEKTSGGTIINGTAIVPDTTSWNTNGTSSPRNYQLITYTDPDGAAWTQTTLDSMQIGYQITATLTDAIGVTNLWASVDYTPASSASVSITQVAANLTATGGTQTVATVNDVSVLQSAATLTFNGGTQSVATVNTVGIAQSGATLTLNGGIQLVMAIQGVSISQVGAILTFNSGTQSVMTGSIVNASVTQIGANLTLTGGIQSLTGQIDTIIAQNAANLTITGGTQVAQTNISIAQGAANLTFTGGSQSIVAMIVASAFVTQSHATLTMTGGTQSIAAIVISKANTWTPEVIYPDSWSSIGDPNPDTWLVNPQGPIDTWDNPNREWDSDYTWDGTTSQVTNAIISSWSEV